MTARSRLALAALALLLTACTSGPLSVNVGTLSAGVLLDGCRLQAGYYDSATGGNDSGEWVLCR